MSLASLWTAMSVGSAALRAWKTAPVKEAADQSLNKKAKIQTAVEASLAQGLHEIDQGMRHRNALWESRKLGLPDSAAGEGESDMGGIVVADNVTVHQPRLMDPWRLVAVLLIGLVGLVAVLMFRQQQPPPPPAERPAARQAMVDVWSGSDGEIHHGIRPADQPPLWETQTQESTE